MTETRVDWTLPHEFEACLSASCVLHETEHCLCGKGKGAEIHSEPMRHFYGAGQDFARRIAAANARLEAILAEQIFRTPPMELRALTWRERFQALNRFDWTEFRSGVGYRFVDDPKSRDLSGLASLFS